MNKDPGVRYKLPAEITYVTFDDNIEIARKQIWMSKNELVFFVF